MRMIDEEGYSEVDAPPEVPEDLELHVRQRGDTRRDDELDMQDTEEV